MARILNFDEAKRKKEFQSAGQSLFSIEGDIMQATSNVYGDLFSSKPALSLFPQHLKKKIEEERLCGYVRSSPETVGVAIDLLCEHYDKISKIDRKEALKKILFLLHGLDFYDAKNQVELTQHPWLVTDILLNKPQLWPGLSTYEKITSENKDWKNFCEAMNFAQNGFLLSYTVCMHEKSSQEVRKNFYRSFPELIDKTSDAIAAFIFNQSFYDDANSNLEDRISKRMEVFDPWLHSSIKTKLKENKWIKLGSMIEKVDDYL